MTTTQERDALLRTLEARFEQNMRRHEGVPWAAVRERLEGNPAALTSLQAMEASGGEPDVVGRDAATGQILFYDCSKQSPAGRRSLCFDRQALDARKKNKPEGSAQEMAEAIGVELLTEAEYRELQRLGEFDTTTSSWTFSWDHLTPPPGGGGRGLRVRLAADPRPSRGTR